jgi:predicted DNA-binding protein
LCAIQVLCKIGAMPKSLRNKQPDAQISFRLPKETLARLRAMALRQDRTISAQAIRAIEIYLKHPEECEALRKDAEQTEAQSR